MNILQRILGINWKTTLMGITTLLAIGTKIIADFKSKDFVTVISDLQTMLTDISGLGIGIGLLVAKDGDTTGAGVSAVKQK